MSMRIKHIKNNGAAKEERIVFEVLKDADIGYFLVFDTTYTQDNKVSNELRHPYWFPDKNVKAGDLVILYTKQGTNTSRKNDDGTSSHFFYWGLDMPILNNDKDCIVLIEARNWKVKGTND
jgi:hypothetical protein